MKKIKFSDSHKEKAFHFFNNLNHPHYSITSKVKIGNIKKFAMKKETSIHIAIVYFIAKAANNIPELKRRIRNNETIQHKKVNPSFTIETKASDTFSFCTVPFNKKFSKFKKSADRTYALMQSNPSFEDTPGKDDYLFLSAIPWIDFSSISHAMNYHPHDSVPRITWGKIMKKKKYQYISVNIQVHHALVNGRELAQFFRLLESYLIAL